MAQRGGNGVRHVPAVTGETEPQRWQRYFSELLQELRVAQTGVQILFAFLLILAFTAGFDTADGFTRTVYLVALLSAAVATVLLIAPVGYHRVLFRRVTKPRLVRYTHRVAFAALVLVVVSMVAAVLLAADVVLSRPVAVVVSLALGVGFVVLVGLLPLQHRLNGDARRAAADGPGGADRWGGADRRGGVGRPADRSV
jgi:hypothetical protein